MPPQLARLIRWYKCTGELVRCDEPLCEIEIQEATVDIPAWRSGVLRCLLHPGDAVTSRSFLATIDDPVKP
jgi:pyruvate/2-oxoglutarate dehydrogenase complex dihydrolipoamide acyltransferase (E2) component